MARILYRESFFLHIFLLHEVDDPDEVIKLVRHFCDSNTVVLVSVPNARSFHRLLAYESGIITSIYEDSNKDKLFNRKTHYDKDKLGIHFIKNGFYVKKAETYFIKILSDKQLEKLVESKIISRKTLLGFDRMSAYIPDLRAEIYLEAKILANLND